MKLFKFIIFSIVFSIFLIPFSFYSFAQGVPGGINGITLSLSTDNPAPGQKVTVTAASYSFDINTATLIWTVSGKQVQKGIGMTTYDVVAPGLGKRTSIVVTAQTTDGNQYNSNISLGSGSIDLIVETDGYTTPFFKGKIPLAFQNNVTVIAFPHLANSSGKEYDPTSLIYQWKKDDGTVLQSQSGFGKQSITLKGGLVPRPYYLIVTASSRDGYAQAQNLIQIAPDSPSIVFYNNDSLYGPLFNSAINNSIHIGSQKEANVFASLYGFNFSPSDISKDLNITWMINNHEHQELAASRSVNFRAPSDSAGKSQVQLKVEGVNNILQSASAGFAVNFDAYGSSYSSSTPVTF